MADFPLETVGSKKPDVCNTGSNPVRVVVLTKDSEICIAVL
jgi:hypothetical protein